MDRGKPGSRSGWGKSGYGQPARGQRRRLAIKPPRSTPIRPTTTISGTRISAISSTCGCRRTLRATWPDLLGAAVTPKEAELVATPYRHGGKAGAAAFFNSGMSQALETMQQSATKSVPLAIYYAFKQSETGKDGIASPGWAYFLQAVVDSGLSIIGTWPLRTELANRMIGMGTNALASSIVLVCRKRAQNSRMIERETFMRALRRELPEAVAAIRAAGIGPVDLAQSAIGPGMAAFTRHAAVLEHSGEKMSVRTALTAINQILDDIGEDDDTAYDLPTRFALDWFAEAGWDSATERASNSGGERTKSGPDRADPLWVGDHRWRADTACPPQRNATTRSTPLPGRRRSGRPHSSSRGR